ncbi:NAD(P)/FAD-dependent oxidoreductase [bacterium]|nr:NAD(P)/FAD-dependent oxidoreductase [bacterium]
MEKYKYIIIGGGMTGSSAVMGIRKNDPDGSIAMFSKDIYGPYNRPPLTKGLWSNGDIENIVRPMDKYDVDLYLDTAVKAIDRDKKEIETRLGERFGYDKLLIASGGHPRHLPDMPDGVIYYRTRSDYEHVRALAEKKQRFSVIGAGFIGSEITAALTNQGKDVTMIFPEVGISGLAFPDDLSEYMNGYYREKGVTVLAGNLAENVSKDGETFKITYKDTENDQVSEAIFDAVIIGVGIKPNVFLAEEAGLSVGDGIIVNDYLQTDDPDIFAAGDVANFFNPGLDERVRVEHEDNANSMGMLAGKNMSGEMSPYEHFPFFYSDLFDMGYEAVGQLRKKDYDIVEDWIDPNKKGAIIYLDSGKVRGVIFWNLWDKVPQGREVIAEGKTYSKDDLIGLFTS